MRKQSYRAMMLTAGLDVSLDPIMIGDTAGSELMCVRFDRGLLKKDLGRAAFGSGALDGYVLHMDTFPNYLGNTYYLFFTPKSVYSLQSNGTFLKLNTGDDYTGTEEDNYSSAMILDHLGANIFVFTNGIDSIKKWDATTLSALGGLTGITSKFLMPFQSRLILGYTVESGYSNPTRVRWSVVGNVEDFSSSGSGFVELVETPDWITGFCQFKNRLIVFKERSIWELVYVGGTTVFAPARLVDGVGTLSGESVISLGDKVVFFGNDSIYLYDLYNLEPISNMINALLYPTDTKVINTSKASRIRVAYIEELEEYWIVFPTQGSVPDLLMKYSFTTNSWTKRNLEVTAFGYYSISVGVEWQDLTNIWSAATKIWVDKEAVSGAPTTLTGDSLGNVYEDDRLTITTDTFVFETKDWLQPTTQSVLSRATIAPAMRVVEMHIQAKGGPFYACYSLDAGLTWSTPELFPYAEDWVENVLYLNVVTQRIRLRITTVAPTLDIEWIEPWVMARTRPVSLIA